MPPQPGDSQRRPERRPPGHLPRYRAGAGHHPDGRNWGAQFDNNTCSGTGPNTCAVAVRNSTVGDSIQIGVDTDIPPYRSRSVTIGGNTYTLAFRGMNGLTGPAGLIRRNELMEGRMPHAVYFNVYCTNNSFVFPENGNLSLNCSKTNALSPGTLFWLDYTEEQVGNMLANGQASPAQATLLRALMNYGGYALVTGSASWAGVSVGGAEAVEGSANYAYYGRTDPFISWANTHGFSGNDQVYIAALGGLPLLPGPPDAQGHYATDWSGRSCQTGCDASGHMRAIDACVAKGMAGVAGGCVGNSVITLLGPRDAGWVTANVNGLNNDHADDVGQRYYSMTMENGTNVTFTAHSFSGHSFAGWSGACTGAGTCTVSLDGTLANSVKEITATFN